MNLDVVRQRLEEENAEEEARQKAEAIEANKSFFDRAWDVGSAIASDVGDAWNTLQEVNQRRREEIKNAVEEYKRTGDFSALQAARAQADESQMHALGGLVLSPAKAATTAFVEANANDPERLFYEAANSIRRSDVYMEYYTTPEEKIKTARDVSMYTGIPAEAILYDASTYKEALRFYEFKKQRDQEGMDPETWWGKYPGLKETVESLDTEGAALILHNRDEMRRQASVIDTFTKSLEIGEKSLELNKIRYKIMWGEATEEEKERAKALEAEVQDAEADMPSFFENPIAYAVSGAGESMPGMKDMIMDGVRDAALTAAVTGGIGAAAGGVGALPGATAGAVGGFGKGVSRSLFARIAGRMLMTTEGRALLLKAAKYGGEAGAFLGMMRPEAGERFAEYIERKDEEGNRVYSDKAAAGAAMLGGAVNAGVEIFPTFAVMGKVLGRSVASTPFTEKVVSDAIANSGIEIASKARILTLAKSRGKDVLSVAKTEALEEGLQSAADDVVDNLLFTITGRGDTYTHTLGDIAFDAVKSSVTALPSSLVFGLAGGGAGVSVDIARGTHTWIKRQKEETRLGQEVQKTIAGGAMLEQLQQIASDGRLSKSAPDIAQKVLRKQLEGTGYEMAYIDTEMAVEGRKGMEDLQKVAEATGMSSEDLQTAIESKATIPVPVEQFAQVKSSPELLQSVTYTQDATSLARLGRDAKTAIETAEEAQKTAVEEQDKLIRTIVDTHYPKVENDAAQEFRRGFLADIIKINPLNPAVGWNTMHKEYTKELQREIATALKALQADKETGEWYKEFYKEHKRKPKKAELEAIAIAMVTGKSDAPQVKKWTEAYDAEYMEGKKEQVGRIQEVLARLDEIKDTAKNISGMEMQFVESLSPEGYKVYSDLKKMLESVTIDGKETAKTAKVNAILWARRADIYAKAYAKATGKPYTALDYMERYGFDFEEKYKDVGGLNQTSAARRLKEDMLAWKEKVDAFFADKLPLHNNVMMRSPLVFDLIGADSSLEVAIDSKILQKLVDKHHFARKDLLELPKKIADPLFVLRVFDTKTGTEDTQKRIVVVDMEINGATVMVPFFLNTSKGLNKIASAYGRAKTSGQPNDKWYIDRLNQKNLLYINKKRTDRWVAAKTATAGSHSAPLTKQSLYGLSIPDETDLGKLKRENRGLYQSAWVGSPTDFDKFDLGYIGTGEGAQVHGYGLYSAQNRNIGEGYREKLEKTELVYDGKKVDELPTDLQEAWEIVLKGYFGDLRDKARIKSIYEQLLSETENRVNEDREKRNRHENELRLAEQNPNMEIPELLKKMGLIDSAEEVAGEELSREELLESLQYVMNDTEKSLRANERVYNLLKRFDPEKIGTKGHGRLYHVEIPEDDVLLDEQKTLKEQPKKVLQGLRKALRALSMRELNRFFDRVGYGSKEYQKIRQEWHHLQMLIPAPISVSQGRRFSRGALLVHGYSEENVANFKANPEHGKKESALLREKYEPRVKELEKQMLAFATQYFRDEYAMQNKTGGNFYQALAGAYESDKAASLALNSVGIKGITYDGRQDGRCYVIFDDKAISIIEKYNQKMGGGTRGTITTLSDNKRIISVFEDGDASTFLHEMGHAFLYDLEELAEIDEAAKKDLQTVNEWATWKEGDAKLYKGTDLEGEFSIYEANIKAAEEAKDFDEADRLKAVWRQERFARAYEAYLHDGQAPAKGLKAVFRRFRAFLTSIYRAFIGEGMRPSPEVRRVMDRMLATEEEIRYMELDDRYSNVKEAGGEKLLTETEEETNARWWNEAQEEAKEYLMKIVMKDLQEEQQTGFKKRLDKEEERFRRELGQESCYLAERALRESGKESVIKFWYPETGKEGFQKELREMGDFEENVKKHMAEFAARLDTELIDGKLTDEAVQEAMNEPTYRAYMTELLKVAMRRKERLEAKITRKTELAMKAVEDRLNAMPEDIELTVDKDREEVKNLQKELGQLRVAARWNDDDYKRMQGIIDAKTVDEAKKAFHEFKQKAKEEKIHEEEVKESATENIRDLKKRVRADLERKPIAEATASYAYTNKARYYARKVREFIKAKKWNKAVLFQQQQLYMEIYAEEARNMRDRVKKDLKKAKDQVYEKSVRLPREDRYWLAHLAYILRIVKNDAYLPKDEEGNPIDMPELRELLEEKAAKVEIGSDGKIEDMHQKVCDIAAKGENFAGYESMNVLDFESALNVMTQIYTTGREKFQLKTWDGIGEEDAVDEIINDETGLARNVHTENYRIRDNVGGLGYNEYLAKMPLGESAARYGQKGLAAITTPEQILSFLGEKAHKYIYGTFEKAAEREGELKEAYFEKLEELVARYSHEERQAWEKKSIPIETADGIENVSKEELLCMALNLGTESNRQRLAGGLGVPEEKETAFREEIQKAFSGAALKKREWAEEMSKRSISFLEEQIAKHMTERDWMFVQDVWDYVGSFWPEIEKTEMELNGTQLKPVAASPFNVQAADTGKMLKLKGGYYPIRYNIEKSEKASENAANTSAKESASGAMIMGTRQGYKKSRAGAVYGQPLLLSFDVLVSHLNDITHNIAMRIAVRDVYRLIANKDFESHVKNTMGEAHYKVIKEWATDVWSAVKVGNNEAESFVTSALRKLRANSTFAIMGFRMWPAIENSSNIGPAIDKIGAQKMGEALTYYTGNWSEANRLVKKSVFMRERQDAIDRDIRRQAQPLSADYKALEWARSHAYAPMIFTDLMVSKPMWVQVYRDSYGLCLQEAIKENEAKVKRIEETRAALDKLKEEQIEATFQLGAIRNHRENRASEDPIAQGRAQESPFAVHNDKELNDMEDEAKSTLRDLDQKIEEAQREFDIAASAKIRTDEEILSDAEGKAVFRADRAVREVFGSGRDMDQSSVQRNKNELMRLLTIFYSYFNTQFNALLAAYRKGKFSGEPTHVKHWIPFARSVFYRILIPSLITMGLKYALGLEGDDERDKYKRVFNPKTGKYEKVERGAIERFSTLYAKNVLLNTSGGIPILRDVTNLAANQIFDGTTYGRSYSPVSVVTRGGSEIWDAILLLSKKSEKDSEIAAKKALKEQKEQETLRKKKGKAKREYMQKLEEDKLYEKPDEAITYSEILQKAGSGAATFTAARTGITTTLVDSITRTMQYMNDEENRYEGGWNILWSVFFDKKPVKREILEKPKKEKKKKSKRAARYEEETEVK
ncbi:hypothetical protein TAMA11512_12850 [Selenomonas sp. TAMA-11512]|uniref:MuF-C-terminal domain-containing protein n=1 Tax=Selenomonas sp. TAMA-11512 TaxID=3095337 RepID=UPI00308DA898|nr:hypothetical protein TAMA11512_12850 [Selenomonas sp. TAMA-11512]